MRSRPSILRALPLLLRMLYGPVTNRDACHDLRSSHGGERQELRRVFEGSSSSQLRCALLARDSKKSDKESKY
ncbi:hypothetical protein MRX96_010813 [Rhipicephalus microplus]